MSETTPLGYFLAFMFVIVFATFALFIATWIVYDTNPITQIIVYKNSQENIESLVTGDWKIVDFSFTSVEKIGNDFYIYVEVANDKIHDWTNDFVVVNRKGEILKQDLTSNMRRYEILI